MDFTVKKMRDVQKDSVRSYEHDLKSQISHCLKQRAREFPYSSKFTLVFVDETREDQIVEQPGFFYVSMNIFDSRMFDSIADWLAGLGYMARKFWFSEQNNNSGEMASISLSW